MKTRFVRSADTGLLVTLLMEANEGDLVTYDQITQHLGRDIRHNRSCLTSALRIAERDGAVFAAEPGKGYRRLPPGDAVASVDGFRARQHNLANRACKRLSVIDSHRLEEPERKKFYTHLSIQGALQAATKAAAVKKIETHVNGSTQQLAVAKTLEALK